MTIQTMSNASQKVIKGYEMQHMYCHTPAMNSTYIYTSSLSCSKMLPSPALQVPQAPPLPPAVAASRVNAAAAGARCTRASTLPSSQS
jgi:hypothetical protein